MEKPEVILQQLKERVASDGASPVIKELKNLLPATSAKYNTLLQIEAELKEVKRQGLEGLLSPEELTRANNRIRRSLLDFIDGLEAADFDANAAPIAAAGGRKRGHVLYRVPHTMELFAETKCIVRIALIKEMLLEDLDLDTEVRIRSEVVVSDFMRVELIDPNDPAIFRIRTTSEPNQFIGEDDYTEWQFYVKPMQPGKHVLQLKIIVMAKINDEYFRREKVLEESVVIVAEPVAEEESALKQAESFELEGAKPKPSIFPPFVVPAPKTVINRDDEWVYPPAPMPSPPVDEITKEQAAEVGGDPPKEYIPVEQPRRRNNPYMMPLLAVVVFCGVLWGATPNASRDWTVARYLRDTPEGYQHFIDNHRKSKRCAEAAFRKAQLTKSPEDYKAYLKDYPEGKNGAKAAWQMALLTNAPQDFQQYLTKYPNGVNAAKAREKLMLLETEHWQKIQDARDTSMLRQFLRDFPQSAHRDAVTARLRELAM